MQHEPPVLSTDGGIEVVCSDKGFLANVELTNYKKLNDPRTIITHVYLSATYRHVGIFGFASLQLHNIVQHFAATRVSPSFARYILDTAD
jgi:hypothetical protein